MRVKDGEIADDKREREIKDKGKRCREGGKGDEESNRGVQAREKRREHERRRKIKIVRKEGERKK